MSKGNNMNQKEELTKLLTDSYDKGVEDAKQAAIIALENTVAVMVAAEREECAKLVDEIEARCIAKDVDDPPLAHIAAAIRARGTT